MFFAQAIDFSQGPCRAGDKTVYLWRLLTINSIPLSTIVNTSSNQIPTFLHQSLRQSNRCRRFGAGFCATIKAAAYPVTNVWESRSGLPRFVKQW